jgi:hypothetical protein
MISLFDLGAHLRFMDLIAPSGKFFFAIARLSNGHGLNLVSTVVLSF